MEVARREAFEAAQREAIELVAAQAAEHLRAQQAAEAEQQAELARVRELADAQIREAEAVAAELAERHARALAEAEHRAELLAQAQEEASAAQERATAARLAAVGMTVVPGQDGVALPHSLLQLTLSGGSPGPDMGMSPGRSAMPGGGAGARAKYKPRRGPPRPVDSSHEGLMHHAAEVRAAAEIEYVAVVGVVW